LTTELAARLAEAKAALATLEEAVARAAGSLIERDSAILRLIYTFSAIGKTCTHLLAGHEGIETQSVHDEIRVTRRLGWLSDEDAEAVIAAGRDRDLAFQMYRAGIGEAIAERLAGDAAVLRRWLHALPKRAADGT
jgi:hypothetical protein